MKTSKYPFSHKFNIAVVNLHNISSWKEKEMMSYPHTHPHISPPHTHTHPKELNANSCWGNGLAHAPGSSLPPLLMQAALTKVRESHTHRHKWRRRRRSRWEERLPPKEGVRGVRVENGVKTAKTHNMLKTVK